MPRPRFWPLLATAACAAAPVGAQAAPLTIMTVSASEAACVYDKGCRPATTDTVEKIPMGNLIDGAGAWLHTRIVAGTAGAPAAGKVGYQYRIDMAKAIGSLSVPCIGLFKLDFGPISKFNYRPSGALADVYVVTSGGPGIAGPTKGEQFGTGINFTFGKPVCAGSGPSSGQTSFLFGLTGEKPPKPMNAQVQADGKLTNVPTRVPAY